LFRWIRGHGNEGTDDERKETVSAFEDGVEYSTKLIGQDFSSLK